MPSPEDIYRDPANTEDPDLENRINRYMTEIDSTAGTGKWEGGPINESQARKQWAQWDKFRDPACPPNTPFRNEKGWPGCFEKPVDTPPGVNPAQYPDGSWERSETSQTKARMKAAGKWQGGQGGQGWGGGGGAGGNLTDQDLALYQMKKVYADALADPTGQQAWKLFAGQGGAENFQNTIDQQRAALQGLPADQRAAAEQRLREMESGMRLQMPQQAYQTALSGLSGVVTPELGYVGSERDRQLGYFNAQTQRQLGQGQLALGQGQLGLQTGAQNWAQNVQFPWEQSEAEKQRQQQTALTNLQGQWGIKQQKESKPGFWGTLGGIAGSVLGAPTKPWAFGSDIRIKEDIAPGRRGLSDLRKLKQYAYKYKGLPEQHQGIMAQDLEKVAPEFVHEFGGIKTIDGYGLLSMTMNAVQELDKKLRKS